MLLRNMVNVNPLELMINDEYARIVPGAFECHRFNLTYDMGHIDLWVDKNTGLIVRDFGEHMNGMTTSSMLQESNLVPPQPEGIPGFPIPSIITGLFVIVFLMTLMNSRERAHAY